VRLAKVYGARVIAIGRRKTQLDRAAAMGAEELICTANVPKPAGMVRQLTGGRGTDIAIEAVGNPETWHWAVDMVRRGGTVNFFGGCPNESRVSLDTSLLHYSEITCKASFHHTPTHIRKALDIVSNGDIAAKDFVNGEEPLTNLLEVMRHLMSHNGHLKTAIIP
jgi:L-iditol 2-dehydrogenase